ncbi:DNA-binding response regulator [Spongiactinospora gelatinilytica]|uniref:DNA-binding response regulator n=1 Tax=Spongiactinospora gelatinilytica TaxID=2666298 RepID=A0A2W2HFH8_9ACTN|nr:response regulator transcription factor [Spongiactinospora gelatinilytica]PZG49040.1 DNA-binding response regulator [Spongiactinospora gelatinilytica]
MIRVLLADDQALIRGAFTMLVGSAPDITVVGEATSGRDAVALARETRADVVVMDIRVVAAGEALLSPGPTATLIAHFLRTPEPSPAAHVVNTLTDREREVFTLIARGLTNGEIAETLVLSPLTVKTCVSRIMTKLNARDRVHLVIAAYQAGLAAPVPPAPEGVSPTRSSTRRAWR